MKSMPHILCVDDESNVLQGLKRILFKHFKVDTATSGAQALTMMEGNHYSVILSDMRMPEMDGAQFLHKAREQTPDTTRILLTGQSDINSAISAINDGNIFRFLLKPCPEEDLISHITEGVRLHQLLISEKDLLENTLKGAIKVLVETLSMVAPSAFSRAFHIKKTVSHIAKHMQKKNRWEFEIAAMLSQIGSIVLPPDLIKKVFSAIELNESEKEMCLSTPKVGAKLVESIPKLENAAKMIQHQQSTDDELNTLSGRILYGAQLLRIANALDQIILRENCNLKKSMEKLNSQFTSSQEQAMIASLTTLHLDKEGSTLKALPLLELRSGMTLDDDVLALNGSIVLPKGQTLNGPLIDRLINFSKGAGIKEPIQVLSS